MAIIETAVVALIFVALGALALIVHELGHFDAARELGLPITRLKLGRYKPSWAWRAKRLPFKIELSPWVFLGAFTQLSDYGLARLSGLSLPSKAWFRGAGVVANIALTFVLLCGYNILGVFAHQFAAGVQSIVCAAAAIATWQFRRALATYLTLPVGVLLLGVIFTPVGASLLQVLGIVELFQFEISSAQDLFKTGALLSLVVALSNCIPFFPADGSRIVIDFCDDKWRRGIEARRVTQGITLVIGFLPVVLYVNRVL